MTHPVDAHLAKAEAAIAAMQEAARVARHVHARAELLRHMRTTARKMLGRPVEEAARLVCGEWMKAWSLDAGAYPALAEDMRRFAAAFCADAAASTGATCAEIEASLAGLERAFEKIGTTLSDQMALRSECAHGWWSAVAPKPGGADAQPFWERGCPPHCR